MVVVERGRVGFGGGWGVVGHSGLGSLLPCPALPSTGGTLSPGGGYVAGRADLMAAVGARLTAPGIGLEAGGVPGSTLRIMFQGKREGGGQGGGGLGSWGLRLYSGVCSLKGIRGVRL